MTSSRSPSSLRRITTHDVAAHAGVSQATVSLVLSGNRSARVAEATRLRVQRAAEDLGYRPNLIARGLVQRRSYAIGVVVPDLGNPFFSDMLRGAERVATEEGYAVLVCEAGEVPAAKHVETLKGRQVDGLILDASGAASLNEKVLAGMNVVLVDEPSDRWPGVASDASGAGRLAAEHLLGLGHRSLGLIGPAANTHGVKMRERGFVRALSDAGIAIPSGWLRRAAPTVSGGQGAMRSLLQSRERPTGVFCVNDLIALGAVKSCLSAGVRVPEGMSVVGCDDIEMARVITPELTTVAVPSRELGARAVRLLLQRLGEKTGRPGGIRPLTVRLVVRGTTSAPASR